MKLSISSRLYLVCGLLVLALLAVCITAWTSLTDMSGKADIAGRNRTQQLLRIAQAELNVTRVSLQKVDGGDDVLPAAPPLVIRLSSRLVEL